MRNGSHKKSDRNGSPSRLARAVSSDLERREPHYRGLVERLQKASTLSIKPTARSDKELHEPLGGVVARVAAGCGGRTTTALIGRNVAGLVLQGCDRSETALLIEPSSLAG